MPFLGEPERLFRQLADMLNLPVSVFRRRADVTADGPTAAECSATVAAFPHIREPDSHRQGLVTVEHCADA